MVMQLRHDEKILDERFASMRELNRRGKTPDPEPVSYTHLDVYKRQLFGESFPGGVCRPVHIYLQVFPAPPWQTDSYHKRKRIANRIFTFILKGRDVYKSQPVHLSTFGTAGGFPRCCAG